MKPYKIFLAALALFTLSACNDDDNDNDNNGTDPAPEMEGDMFIKFDHVWGPVEQPFALDMEMTHPASGEVLEFTKLRYYVTNIELHKATGGTWKEEESYHLITVDDQAGLEEELQLTDVPAGDYVGISYIIGVDSLRNVSGLQEGALDPAEAMFWSWNTGYIFVKAEGMSDSSPNGSFVYHIGGFEGPNSAIREMYHDFQGATLEILPDANPSVHIVANAARFWHGGLSTAQTPNVHMPGDMASTLATNFSGGFRFDHIHN